MTEKWMKNQAGDGYMPCCKKCGNPFEDAEVGDVKNYPEDGGIAVFFTCEDCKEESEFTYKPDMSDPALVRDIKILRRSKVED
jgi:RNase P subunit RPR2